MRLFKIYVRYFFRRLVFLIYLLLFVVLYFLLDNEYFNLVGFRIQNPFYEFLTAQTKFNYIIVIIAIFAFVSTITEIILTIIHSRIQTNRLKKTSEINNEINSKLFIQLFDNQDLDSDISFVQEHKRQFAADYPQLVLINRLRRISILTKGNIHKRSIRLFHLLNADDLITTYLKSPYLRHKLLAIRIISDFKLKAFIPDLKKLIHHKKDVISSEAMQAYVKADFKTTFEFLIERNRPISKLEMYNFILIAANYKHIDYRMLITSSIDSISALGLRFAGLHGIITEKAEIFKRINHPSAIVSDEAQSAYLEMIDEHDAAILLSRFDVFNTQSQVTILQMMAEYTDNPMVLNLFSTVIEQYDYEMKKEALGILLQHNISASLKYRKHANIIVQNAYSELTDF